VRTDHTPPPPYADCTIDGHSVSLEPGSHLLFNGQRVPLPPVAGAHPPRQGNLLTPRLRPDGLAFAGQGHEDRQCWEWVAGMWHDRGPAVGNNAAIYHADGTLEIVRALGTFTGALGWRYVADDGTLVATWETYDARTPMSIARGLPADFWEWTERGDIILGQGPGGLHAFVPDDRGGRRRIEILAGDVKYIRFYRTPAHIRFAAVVNDTAAVQGVYRVADLRAMPTWIPRVDPPTPDPPVEPPPVDPPIEEPPMPPTFDALLANQTDVLEGVKRDYPHLGPAGILDQAIHRLNRKHKTDVFGRKGRNPDGGNPNEDVITVRRNDHDLNDKYMIDALEGSKIGLNRPRWDVLPLSENVINGVPNGYWRPAVAKDLDVIIEPEPEEPTPEEPEEPGEPLPGENASVLELLRAILASNRNQETQLAGLRVDVIEAVAAFKREITTSGGGGLGDILGGIFGGKKTEKP
jgi:hypothetical protein